MATEIQLFKLINEKLLCFLIKMRNYVLLIHYNFNLMLNDKFVTQKNIFVTVHNKCWKIPP
jgi:hypothetical protein